MRADEVRPGDWIDGWKVKVVQHTGDLYPDPDDSDMFIVKDRRVLLSLARKQKNMWTDDHATPPAMEERRDWFAAEAEIAAKRPVACTVCDRTDAHSHTTRTKEEQRREAVVKSAQLVKKLRTAKANHADIERALMNLDFMVEALEIGW